MEEWLDRLELLIGRLERMQLDEYLRYVNDKKRFLRVNLLIGMMRGLGTVIGFTILGAVLVAVLQRILTGSAATSILRDIAGRIAAGR